MNFRNKLCLLLAAILLLCLPLTVFGGFADIDDPETAKQVDVLQTMGVIAGTGGTRFEPNGTLTRAQFTKMAVTMLGRAEEATGYQSFTIFPDVKSSHWASGFINLAVRGENKFIAGFADGSFGPEKNISYGEAITILMRLLGYKDTDVGLLWPTGYINAAATAGLTKNMSLTGGDTLTRAQAAQLFCNLLGSRTKGTDGAEGGSFAEAISPSAQKDVILLDANAKTTEGAPAVETTKGTYKLAGKHAPTLLQGSRGTLLLDKRGDAWTFVPSSVGTAREIVVSVAKAGNITDKNGQEHTLTASTVAFYDGKETSYGEIFVNLRSGTRVTLHMGVTGKIESLFVGSRTAEAAVVIDKDGDGARLGALTGGRRDYKIYRNGELVAPAALRQYDVATYVPSENAIYISSFRISGRYNNAYPNTDAPTKIKMLGREFDVLPSATAGIARFKIGAQMTLLLTPDMQIAAVVETTKARGTAIGIASITGSDAKVTLPDGLVLEGKVEGSNPASSHGQLVTVSSSRDGYLTLFNVKESGTRDNLDVAGKKLGTKPLSADIQIYERVKTGPVSAIAVEDIRTSRVSADKILYARHNDAGKINLLILDNVTGDSFLYGRAYTEVEEYTESRPIKDGKPDEYETIVVGEREVVRLKHAKGEAGPYLNASLRTGEWVGIVADEQSKRVVGTAKLTRIAGVRNADFESEKLVYLKGESYAVSEDVACYNNTTGQWVSLGAARAFGDLMTIYVDDFKVVRVVEVTQGA